MSIRGFLGLLALSSVGLINAATVEHYWNATWVWAAPDGYGRPVIGVNGQWPGPEIVANKGDQIVVHLTNALGNQTTGIHWHGINQVGTVFMDGPTMTTQCPLPPDMTLTYTFTADAAGTYWWHSHDLGQYPDGLRGPLIVRDPDDPFAGEYDEEYTLTITDWYHHDSVTLVRGLLDPSNRDSEPPLPDTMLLNDGKGADYPFDKSKTYRFRIISLSALPAFMVNFNSHKMTVIMTDGSYIDSEEVDQLRVSPGQRYDVLIKGDQSDSGNYPFLVSMDGAPDYTNPATPPAWIMNATGYLVMDEDGSKESEVVYLWAPADDSKFKPYPNGELMPEADKVFQLAFTNCFDENDTPRYCFNDNMGDQGPYVPAKVPSLYTAVTTGDANDQRVVYGHVHPLIIDYGDIVDIVVNNLDDGIHPFHLHGHQFQVIERPGYNGGTWPGTSQSDLNQDPPSRDTVDVYGSSYVRIRFKADNPGVYLFHCHIDWHVPQGLTATVIEAPDRLRNYTIPEEHIAACQAQGIAYAGNAGGNTEDVYDTSNIPTVNEIPYQGANYPDPDLATNQGRRGSNRTKLRGFGQRV